MEWYIYGGYHAAFYNPINIPSYQSVLGQAPNFNPSALYYGLLTFLAANYGSPYIVRPAAIAGTSSKIKAYGLDLWYDYRILLLNKDNQTNASGIVKVTIEYLNGMTCWYTSATSLASTTGIKMAGYSFKANSSRPVGLF